MRYYTQLLLTAFLFACQEASPPSAPTSDPEAGSQAVNHRPGSGTITIVNLGFTAALDLDEQGRVVGWKSARTGAQAVVWTPSTARGTTGSLTVLSGLGGDTYAWGLNDGADITGGSTVGTQLHAVVWSSGALRSIEPAGAVGSFAEDVTNPLSDGTRLIAGHSDFPAAGRATAWRVSGTGSSLAVVAADLLPGLRADASGQAIGINSSGVVVGDAETDGSNLPHPVRWTLSGGSWSITALGLLPGQTYGQVYDVSSTGDAVGMNRMDSGTACAHGAAWPATTSEPRPLQDLAGGSCSIGWAINAAGQITGSARDSQGRDQAVLWLPTGTGTYNILALGNIPGASRSEGRGLNSPQADGTGGTVLEVVGHSGGSAVLWKVKLP